MWDLAERLSQNGLTMDWSSAFILSENDRNTVSMLVAEIANELDLIRDDMFCDILLHFIINYIVKNEPDTLEDVKTATYQYALTIQEILNCRYYQKSTLNWQNNF